MTDERSLSRRNFGILVRARRVELGISQVELAQAVEINVTYLSKIEQGHMLPSAPTAIKLAKALGLDPVDLLCARRDPPPDLDLTPRQWVALSVWLSGKE